MKLCYISLVPGKTGPDIDKRREITMAQITSWPLYAYSTGAVDYNNLTWANQDKVRAETNGLKTTSETLHKLCDTAAWLMIIDQKHPGEGYRTKLIDQLTLISKHFGGLGNRHQAALVARLLGGWDVEKGCGKGGNACIIPVRSLMDM